MAGYEDFTNYTYMESRETNTYNIGWLEGSGDINKGKIFEIEYAVIASWFDCTK